MQTPSSPVHPPIYTAARLVAAGVHDHFCSHVETAGSRRELAAALVPDQPVIEAITDAAFWASLRREEGYAPRISLAFLPPEHAGNPLRLERPLPLAPGPLARLAPAVERPGIHLGVWRADHRLHVWGTTQAVPPFCFVLEVVAPGLLVMKHRRAGDRGKFVNVAVLEGDRIKMVDERASSLPDCPALLSSLLGFDAPAAWRDGLNVLVQLAVSMRAHGRGGSLLVVPAGTDAWQESIVRPVTYAVSPSFAELADVVRAEAAGDALAREGIERAVHALAGLTAIDGATVMTDRYELLAFGVKIGRRESWPQVERIVVTEPIQGAAPEFAHPVHLGGTRHLSAAQFVQDQRNAVALVASQDGPFTIFAWSPCEEMVHAHRVEALLL